MDDDGDDDDLESAVERYENFIAQDANAATPLNDIFNSSSSSNNNNNNNNNSHDIDNINASDQDYWPLSDNEIISAARKFRILLKSLSSPVKKSTYLHM